VVLNTIYCIPTFLSWCSQSSRSEISGTTTMNVFFVTIAATIGIMDLPLPVGSTTSRSDFPSIAYLTTSYCSLNVQLQLDEWKSLFRAASCSNLAWDDLITLQVQVDKNLMKLPLDSVHYLYSYYMVCALLSHTYHITWHCDILDMWP